MNKRNFTNEIDGFYATYYPKENAKFAFIALTGDDTKDLLAKTTAKWFNNMDINVLTMSPNKNDYSHHSLPLERIEKAIKFLLTQGNTKIGIIGLSTTAMLALVAASYFEDLSLVIALSPSDFVMEGFYKEKGKEKPGNHESSISYKGKDLPYLKYAYRDPEYNLKLKEEAKLTKNLVASRKMFDESEKLDPLTEENRIKVENIKGTIVLVGAKDDCMWNTVKYINRMREVLLNSMKKGANARFLTYKHGTHFVLPESLMKTFHLPTSLIPSIFFKEARLHKKECKETRIDIDKNIREAIKVWKEVNRITCANEKFEFGEN